MKPEELKALTETFGYEIAGQIYEERFKAENALYFLWLIRTIAQEVIDEQILEVGSIGNIYDPNMRRLARALKYHQEWLDRDIWYVPDHLRP